MNTSFVLRRRGVEDYLQCWQAMMSFTECRDVKTKDEIWLVQHPSVYTRGVRQSNKPLDVRLAIPVVDSDRGGLMTYHGPGQLIFYLLLDVKRLGIGPKSLVYRIEQAVIDFLSQHSIPAQRKPAAPGIFVEQGKIAALGLRLTNGFCYHGLSFNYDLDLKPYEDIVPCGDPHMKVTRLYDIADELAISQVESGIVEALHGQLHLESRNNS